MMTQNRPLMITLFTFAAIAATTGCMESPEGDSDGSSVVAEGRAWENPSNSPVCFVNPLAYPDLPGKIKSLVDRNYRKTNKVRFQWFDLCDKKIPKFAIRLKLVPNDSMGDGVAGLSEVGRVDTSGKASMKVAVGHWQSATVHEFGHALGLLHEHRRDDQLKSQPLKNQCIVEDHSPIADDTQGHHYVGDYDPESTMSYCSRKTDLSQGDIEGINYLYRGERLADDPDPEVPDETPPTELALQVDAFSFKFHEDLNLYELEWTFKPMQDISCEVSILEARDGNRNASIFKSGHMDFIAAEKETLSAYLGKYEDGETKLVALNVTCDEGTEFQLRVTL